MSYLNAKTLKKSRKLRKKRPKRKSSRKRQSTKRKSSRKKSPKRKSSRKRPKRKSSRKRQSTKRKGKKLKFRITSSERAKIAEIFKKDKDDPEALCSICHEPLLFLEDKEVSNKDIVGCMGASEIPGWTCCSKTKKTGCKNSYFHKKCIKRWVKHQESQHRPPSCPICREKKVTKKPPSTTSYAHLAAGSALALMALNGPGLLKIAGNLYRGGQIRRCYDPGVNSIPKVDGVTLPRCRGTGMEGCTYIKDSWNGVPHVFEYEAPNFDVCPLWMADSWRNWEANREAEEREREAKDREYGGESGSRTELMPGSLMAWNKDDLGAKKDVFRMQSTDKPWRDPRYVRMKKRRAAAAKAAKQEALKEEARVANMDEKTRAAHLKKKADKEAHEKKRDEEFDKLQRKFMKEKEEWKKAWMLKNKDSLPDLHPAQALSVRLNRAFDEWLLERSEKDSALAERVRKGIFD